MTTATTPTAEGLIGETWTDEKGRNWKVRNVVDDGAGVRAVRIGTGVGKNLTLAEAAAAIAAQKEADYIVASVAEIDPVDLIGRTWTDAAGSLLTVVSLVEVDGVKSLTVSDPEGFEQAMGVDDVFAALRTEAIAPETPDATLADAGAIEDEQYRNRQQNPDAFVPRVISPWEIGQGSYLDDLAAALRRMQTAVTRSGGKATITTTITLEETAPRELEIVHQVSESPPKVKQSSTFFLGGVIVPGLPKRDSDAQLTLVDAEPSAGASIEERIAADETADPGAVADANPLQEGVPTDAEKAEAKRAAASQDDEVPADLVDDEEVV